MKKTAYYLTITMALIFGQQVLATESNPTTEELRAQIDALSKRLEQVEKSNAAVSNAVNWTSRIKIKADVRYRFEHIDLGHSTYSNRQRMRVRVGIFGEVNDWVEAGVGIRTGEKANSGNIDLGDGFSGFDVSMELAFIKLFPWEEKYGVLTLGKFKQPWKNYSNLIWDSDVNPEGITYGYQRKISKASSLFSTLGYYRVTETKSTHDLNLGGAQLGGSHSFSDRVSSSLAGSIYYYDNTADFGLPYIPDYQKEMDFTVGQLSSDFSIKQVGPVTLKFYGDVTENFAENKNTGAYLLGIKFLDPKEKWEFKYDYRVVGVNAAPAGLVDSDIADGGTGIYGHYLKGKYNIAKHLSCGVSLLIATRDKDRTGDVENEVNTLMLDLIAKF
jgi:hypothetical protein